MDFITSLMTGIMMMVFVFFVLVLLYFLIRGMSYVLMAINNSVSQQQANKAAPSNVAVADSGSKMSIADTQSQSENIAFGGNVILTNVDEPTAAMLMAIVSDQSGIPLSELCFKSIKALPTK